ncbi:phosphoglycerate kinase [Candidatus Pacearchaeota archaeon]|nr:MAG: phosphoglycerate kinase [Candidatus Pacearchaeota archaeon]
MKPVDFKKIGSKRVLLRVDINSDVQNGKVIDSPRIRQAAETIKLFKKAKAKVTVIAHQGNPGKRDFVSLKKHAELISKITKIEFVRDITGSRAEVKIKNLKPGRALLLENLRFNEDEIKNPSRKNSLAKLAEFFDIYVNDAFSVCHRPHASMTLLPKILPSFAGPNLEKEVASIKKIRLKNSLYILGGGKPESNVKLLSKKKIIAAGFFGQMILIARGFKLGYQEKFLRKNALISKSWNSFMRFLRKNAKHVMVPVDFAINVSGRRHEVLLNDFPQKFRIDDIGTRSIELFKKEISRAPSIYMKGPVGYASNRTFAKGTIEILKAVSNSRAFSVVGGGQLSEAIRKYRISKDGFGHISLSGGALLNFVAGEKLPGLEALG